MMSARLMVSCNISYEELGLILCRRPRTRRIWPSRNWYVLTQLHTLSGTDTNDAEGMVAAAKWARENKKPYLGICLGMQIAVIEYARNVCGIPKATSEEFDSPGENVVIFMPEIDKATMGGTMRLGRRATHFQADSEWSKLRQLYGRQTDIHERHRHRYEVNPACVARLEAAGLPFVGKDDTGERMEVIELKGDHPFFVGVQFHPEYLSRVLSPSPPYLGLVAASAGCLDEMIAQVQQRAQGNGDAGAEMANGVNGVKLHDGGNGNGDF